VPGVSEHTAYGTPALKLGKKSLCRIKDADTLVFMCELEEKAALIEAVPDIYFETDHYKGWPAVLARLPALSDEELVHRLRCAVRFQTAKRLAKG
jgi:hypothetical protein